MKTYDVLNLGAGWQSSMILLMSCRGELPKFNAAVFSDTQWEPPGVYAHLQWLKEQAAVADIPLIEVTAGNLRQDGIDFRSNMKSADGKRYASIPVFVKNPDGSHGRVKRQCTKEYKIEPVDRWIRRELLGMRPSQRFPKDVIVRQWFGISADESGRATFPGVWKKQTKTITNLFGEQVSIEVPKRWKPSRGRQHVYPLLNEIRNPDRSVEPDNFFLRPQTRTDVGEWLRREFPHREIPRSACIGCPFHDNDEWRDMRDNRPEEWRDAIEFDEAMRVADKARTSTRPQMVGTLYLHQQRVPLALADLDGDGEKKGGGCGTLFDGMDGMCGV